MSDTTDQQGTLEKREDAGRDNAGIVKFWLEQLDIASAQEADWREDAEDAEAIYRGGRKNKGSSNRRWNILYSNTETMAAAIYNTTPAPDIRRRYGDGDDAARQAAQALERCVSFSLDQYDPDISFRSVAKDGLVPGRGLLRVRLSQRTDEAGNPTYQEVTCEPVDWRSFRRGAAKTWDALPWIAFRHYLPRSEVEKLNADIGAKIGLDYSVPESGKPQDKGDNISDVFKRGEVWEIWDKERREVLFIAPSHKDAPLKIEADPLRLAGFFPVPRPFQPIEIPAELTPVEPFRLYRSMANELEELTRRIQALTKAIRWRGAYNDPQIGDFLAKFEKLDDGDMAPLQNPRPDADMAKAFWFQPIREAAEVLARLYEAREQVKATIYEITGIADLLRGQSVASETATAQNIKAQWGSLRVSTMQLEMQRLVRDVIRLKVELIAEHFTPQMLQLMSGMQLDDATIQLMKSDPMRRYRVDVETDSTIRADLQRQQQNISGFVTGLGSFMTAIGPGVQSGAIPMEVAKTMLQSFSRTFKLGRSVEEALDTIPNQMPQQADPNAAAQAEAQAKAQAEQQKAAMEAQAEQARMMADQQKTQATLQHQAQLKQMEIEAENEREARRLQADMAKHADVMQLEREKMALEAATRAAEHDARERESERKAEQEFIAAGED